MLHELSTKLSSLVGDHHYLGRYSLEKLHLFEEYQRFASPLRVASVLTLTPLPTFVMLFALSLIPMSDPRAGPRHNATAFARSTITHALRTFHTLLPLKQALSLSSRDYSFATIACVALCTALTMEALCISLAFGWRFPVPFSEFISFPLFLSSLVGYNLLFARRTMRQQWRKHTLQPYLPVATARIIINYTLIAVCATFTRLSVVLQTILMAAFPLVKFLLKHLVWKRARLLNDISTDMTICMVSITGALCQIVGTQFINSNWLNAWMVVADLLQAMHEVRSYVALDYMGDGRDTLKTARTILDSALNKVENRNRRASFSSAHTQRYNESDASNSRLTSAHSHAASAHSHVTIAGDTDVDVAIAPALNKLKLSKKRSPPATRPTNAEVQGSEREMQYTVRSVYIPQSKVRLVRLVRGKNARRLLDLRGSLGPEDGEAEAHTSENSVKSASTNGRDTTRQKTRKPRQTGGGTSPGPLQQSVSLGLMQILSRLSLTAHRRPTGKIYAITGPETHDDDNRNEPETAEPSETVATQVQTSPQAPPPPQGEAAPVLLRPNFARRRSSISHIRIDGVRIASRHQARLLEQTLQLLFTSEVLLFAEYVEVVVPVLYALCLGNEWLSSNAKYNVIATNMTTQRVITEISSSLGFAMVEMVSLLAMYWFMKRRYGISALYQLSFVLETYWMTLQGKLVGTFLVVFNAVTVHQGSVMIL